MFNVVQCASVSCMTDLNVVYQFQINQPVILKNVPSINRLLDEIKHLLRILPLTFPHGVPENEDDFEHTFINVRGEMIVKKRLKQFEPAATDLVPSPEEEKWKLQFDTVKKDLDKRLLSHSVHIEHFQPVFKYKRNEDKKEYRYTFNKDVPTYAW